MATIKDVLNNWNKLDFEKVCEQTVVESESDIIYLNVNQMQDGQGSDGNQLKNTDKRYKGVYKPLTAEIASKSNPILSKSAGELYNFGNSGAFLSNMDLKVKNLEYTIFSTGTGIGEKKAFFDGYKNMFGLNSKSRTTLINDMGFQNKLIKNIKNVVRL